MKNYFFAAALALTMGATAVQAQTMPDALYFVGNVNNWTTPDVAEGSNLITMSPTSDGIYECTFDYNEETYGGSLEFKIFSAKSNWDDSNNTWGTFEPTVSYTSGNTLTWMYMVSEIGNNFQVSNYTADKVHVSIDWYSKVMKLNDGEPEKAPETLHLVGDFNGWDPANHDYPLALSMTEEEGTHYTGTFTLPSCQFKVVVGDDWSENYGAYDQGFFLWSDRTYTAPMLANYGYNFICNNWKEGKMTVNVDWDNKIISLITPDQPAYSVPESLHLAGAFNNWDVTNHDYVLTLNKEVNHTEYVGVFDIPAYGCEFKILTGDSWDDSFGAAYYGDCQLWKDMPAYFMLTADNAYNFNCTNWEGGKLRVTVNWDNFNVMLEGLDQPAYEEPKKEDVLYLIGAPQGWDIKSDAIKLASIAKPDEKAAIYGGTVEIKEGEAMFRFYTELGDWESNSVGSQVNDNPIDITVIDGFPYQGSCVWGKGSWNIPAWEGGMLYITVNLMNMEVEFSANNTGVGSVVSNGKGLRYAAGVVTAADDCAIVVVDAAGRVVKSVNGASADLSTLPGGIYIVKAGDSVIKVRK